MTLRTYPVSKTRYGRFSPDGTEYVITEPDLPRPWLNLMANGTYQIVVSQTLGGMSLYNQDLRINNHFAKSDVPGKHVYLRDDETGKYYWRHERASRLYDGADEVHKMVVARRILREYQ